MICYSILYFKNTVQYSSSDNIALRESSFHMKRRGDEDIEGGGAPKIFRHPKGEL